MTILSAINDISSETGLDQFDSVYGSDDPNAIVMLSLAKAAGEEISRRADFKAMLKDYTTPSSPSPLPEDFHRLIPGGAVQNAAGSFFRPVANGSQWQFVKSVPSAQFYFYMVGSTMQFSPEEDGIGANISYVSKNWILSGGVPVSNWGSDDDTVLFRQRLLERNIIWRWRRRNGLDYADHLAEFEADMQAEIKADRGV